MHRTRPSGCASSLSRAAFAQGGDATHATVFLEKAVSICPLKVYWRHSLGVVYGLAGRWREAADAFRVVLLDPNHLEGRVCYAAALLETGRPEEALAEKYGKQYVRPLTRRSTLSDNGKGLRRDGTNSGSHEMLPAMRTTGAGQSQKPRKRGRLSGKSGEESL